MCLCIRCPNTPLNAYCPVSSRRGTFPLFPLGVVPATLFLSVHRSLFYVILVQIPPSLLAFFFTRRGADPWCPLGVFLAVLFYQPPARGPLLLCNPCPSTPSMLTVFFHAERYLPVVPIGWQIIPKKSLRLCNGLWNRTPSSKF